MSPIIHAMTARPVELPFLSRFKHTNIIDRDFLVFDAYGNIIIDSDGLPKQSLASDGLPMVHGTKAFISRTRKTEPRKRHITTEEGRKNAAVEAILAMLKPGKPFTCTEISDSTGVSRVTVAKHLKGLVDTGVCKTKEKRIWKKLVTHFYIAKI